MSNVIAIRPAAKTALVPRTCAAGSRKLKVTCSNCNLRELCLPKGLDDKDMQRMEEIVYARRRLKRGETLFRAGEAFSAVYAIRSGFFKTTVLTGDGREQVTGFHMAGELLGIDGIATERYNGNAIALEDCEACVLPFAVIESLGREIPALQRNLHGILSREIVHDHGVMMLLGSMRAEERLATFLLNLSRRFARRGYSSLTFHLRMTREEIGGYLGLKLETISREFSQFQDKGILEVNNKHIEIRDLDRLRAVIGQDRVAR